ncbi:PPC domain-containing protein [Vibrio sp. SCSIO 43136]|uniref:PPC domain-containing protein n=1 Tax=Vibrio sp. SCSIO 43136 TaxID=2819101 RepID=UPI002074E41D|nr:PPC domain-containing protein [Vibrio sp. SCSIO 43136]USD66890.1 PPC domain-containing protein [Vibrio sp. SCSIO 43136]
MRYTWMMLALMLPAAGHACSDYDWDKANDLQLKAYDQNNYVAKNLQIARYYEAETPEQLKNLYQQRKILLEKYQAAKRNFKDAKDMWNELFYDCDGKDSTTAKKVRDKIKERIEILEGVEVVVKRPEDGLKEALAKVGAIEFAKQLHGASFDVTQRQNDDAYPISAAASHRQFEYFDYLLSIGADINVPSMKFYPAPIISVIANQDLARFNQIIDKVENFDSHTNVLGETGNAIDEALEKFHVYESGVSYVGDDQEESNMFYMLNVLYRKNLSPVSQEGQAKLALLVETHSLDKEGNDSMETAVKVRRKAHSLANYIDGSQDVDYYRIDLKKESEILFSINRSVERGNEMLMEVLNSSGNVLGTTERALGYSELTGTISAGTYYVRVRGEGMGSGLYSLSVEY